MLPHEAEVTAEIDHLHGTAQQIKMLNEWKNTRGLKRNAPKAILNQLNTGVAKALKKLPAVTDVTRHWSGQRHLQQAMQALRGDVMYATLYRHTSSISRASDLGAHFEAEPASGESYGSSSDRYGVLKRRRTLRASCAGPPRIGVLSAWDPDSRQRSRRTS
jgi:hypothetical protein